MSHSEAKKKWWAYHKQNPHVYAEFERLALHLISLGVPKCSHWLICNQIRWNHMIKTKADDFKINNNYFAYYARLFLHLHQDHAGFFELRELKEG